MDPQLQHIRIVNGVLEAHVIDGVPEEDQPAVHYPRSLQGLQLLKSCWKFVGLLFNESFVQSLRDIDGYSTV